ncbi:hypothetical protein KUCAC02_025270, partial [Chaenocephalus aceratus]
MPVMVVMLGDITQKGYEKKRSKLIGAFFPQTPGMMPSLSRMDPQGQERRGPVTPSSSSRYHRRRSSGSRDERVPIRNTRLQKRLLRHSPNSIHSGKTTRPLGSRRLNVDTWEHGAHCAENTAAQTQLTVSLLLLDFHWKHSLLFNALYVHTEAVQAALAKHKERKLAVPMPSKRRSLVVQTSMDAYTPPENHSAPPDVTGYTNNSSSDGIQVERAPGQRQTPKYGNAELMETGDALKDVRVSMTQCHVQQSAPFSRVSAKIQQLVNTLKRPKRPPLREFFVDDFEELLEVQQPDPNQPKAEGAQMEALQGEQLGVVTNWPPSLEAALQRWGTISPKAPCLTTMDTNGKPLYLLTYGKLWSRSVKVAFNLLHKLGTKQEPLVRPGDR